MFPMTSVSAAPMGGLERVRGFSARVAEASERSRKRFPGLLSILAALAAAVLSGSLQNGAGRKREQQPDQQGSGTSLPGRRLEAFRQGALHAERDLAVVHAGAPPASSRAAPASTMLTQMPIAAASATWATISAAINRVLVIAVLLCVH